MLNNIVTAWIDRERSRIKNIRYPLCNVKAKCILECISISSLISQTTSSKFESTKQILKVHRITHYILQA
jgi:hypothetical protein